VFDIAWSELALIAAVALIVIGPKDLPRVMRNVGQWTRRARSMAAEFQRNLDDMMREAELDEIRREVEKVSPADFKANLEKMVDAKGIAEAVKIDPDKLTAAPEPPPAATSESPLDPTSPPPGPALPVAEPEEPAPAPAAQPTPDAPWRLRDKKNDH
jgi:sec-independent protein translocase protein TatB